MHSESNVQEMSAANRKQVTHLFVSAKSWKYLIFFIQKLNTVIVCYNFVFIFFLSLLYRWAEIEKKNKQEKYYTGTIRGSLSDFTCAAFGKRKKKQKTKKNRIRPSTKENHQSHQSTERRKWGQRKGKDEGRNSRMESRKEGMKERRKVGEIKCNKKGGVEAGVSLSCPSPHYS